MKYDVFISYSRKDSVEVSSLIERLRREIPGIKIWFDIEGVESADEFKRKIISAIEDSAVLLFACSDNSLSSDYCEKEVTYAKNIGKRILPFLLKGSKLKGWLLFDYGNINCIHSSKEEEVNRMINDLKRWMQKADREDIPAGDTHLTSNPSDQESVQDLSSQLEFDPISGEFGKKNNTGRGYSEGYINGHEFVDLGLPSGLKWATCNVGASEPEKFGDYFAWGETKPKSSYDSDNSVTFPKGLSFTHRDNVILDCHGNLKPSYDAATVQWGAPWRLPTLEEIDELVQNTVAEWKTLYSVKGLLVKSKINGKGIFLPAAGNRALTETYFLGECGYYWSSTPSNVILNYRNSWGIYFSDGDCFNSLGQVRYHGCLIRPVSN